MTSCLTDDVIAEVATPGGAPLTTQIAEHLADCGDCRGRFAGAVSVLHAPVVAAEIARLDAADQKHKSGRVWKRSGIAALAASVGGLLLLPALMRESGPSSSRDLRDDESTMTMTMAPSVVAPRGTVSTAPSLTWKAVPGADRYQATIFDETGGVVWSAQATDTVLSVPNRIIRNNKKYLWNVRARTSFDRWAESDLVEFSVYAGRDGN
ncbi:MAG TPA: hypothetical protein VM100_05250 [Longimicrobiales bacterium]|nr:hypothetical protein [Longimicrobiales bacterium]